VFEKQNDGHTLKRKADDAAPDLESLLTPAAGSSSKRSGSGTSAPPAAKKAKPAGGTGAASLGIKIVKKKKPLAG
jgi:hypothetical protein